MSSFFKFTRSPITTVTLIVFIANAYSVIYTKLATAKI